MKAIVDTGFLVAYARQRDRHHRWAVRLATETTESLLTCEAVLAETAFHLESSAYVLSLIETGLVRLEFEAARHLVRLQALAERYADRSPDFADLCLIRMSELFPNHPVITIDEKDFGVYRRNQRERIPLICPP